MLWAVQCDVGRVDLAALGKCGSRIGLVSARASSACEVPVELAGGPSFKLVAILVTAVRVCPGNYLGLSVCLRIPDPESGVSARQGRVMWTRRAPCA